MKIFSLKLLLFFELARNPPPPPQRRGHEEKKVKSSWPLCIRRMITLLIKVNIVGQCRFNSKYGEKRC